MHFYQHNIKDFNNATRHLTRVERSLYRDAIELYYDSERPLPAVDFDHLARRLLANTDEEKAALLFILGEFFERTGDVWSHDRCDEEIEKYREGSAQKSRAGKASAEARKKAAEERKRARKGKNERNLTDVKQTLNDRATNQEPLTINQEPIPNNKNIPPKNSGGGDSENLPVVKKSKFEDRHMQTAIRLSNPIKQRFPTQKINLAKWAEDVEKIERLDKYPLDQVCELWGWIQNHVGGGGFSWADQIRTPAKLREHDKQGLKYLDKLTEQMRRVPTGAQGGGKLTQITNRNIAEMQKFLQQGDDQ